MSPSTREHVFTASPITVPSIRLAVPTVPSISGPVWMPTPASIRSSPAADRSSFSASSSASISSAAAIAVPGSGGNSAMIASPMYLSMTPSFRSTIGTTRPRYSLMNSKVRCGVRRSEIAVKSRMSENRIVSSRSAESPSPTSTIRRRPTS